MPYRMSPQRWLGTVARAIPDLAVFQQDLNGTSERLHWNLELAWQTGLVVRRLERLPQRVGIADQPISRVKGLGHVESGKAPLATLRISRLAA